MNLRIVRICLPLAVLVVVAAACGNSPAGDATRTPEPAGSGEGPSPAGENSSQTIKGLTVTSMTKMFKQKGFDCTGPISFDASGQPMQQWDCVRRGDGTTDTSFPARRVSIVARNASEVNAVLGSFLDPRSTPDTGAALEFFKTLAGITYVDARPIDAQKWVETNSANGAQTTFGSAEFTLVPMRQLRIMAPGSAPAR